MKKEGKTPTTTNTQMKNKIIKRLRKPHLRSISARDVKFLTGTQNLQQAMCELGNRIERRGATRGWKFGGLEWAKDSVLFYRLTPLDGCVRCEHFRATFAQVIDEPSMQFLPKR